MSGGLDSATPEGLVRLMRSRLSDRAWDSEPEVEAELADLALRAGRSGDRDSLREVFYDAIEALDEPERSAVRVMVGVDPRFRSVRVLRKTILEEMGRILDTRTEPMGTPGLGRRQVEKLEREVLVPMVADRLSRMLSTAVSVAPTNPPVQMPSTGPIVSRPAVIVTGRNAIILDRVRRLIAQHGLDDPTWANALSAQYFLVLLARRLGMTDQQDYLQLMNRFLGSFTYLVSDQVVLNPDRVLVTPEELENIQQCMREEDERDPVFTKTTKTQADKVDTDLLHLNYLYGLTVAIAGSPPRGLVLRALEDAAIDHLVHQQGRLTLDEYGGWIPYRIPWVTARVLISLSHVDLSTRRDAPFILRIIDAGIRSLIDRQVDGTYWRSGVGTWVSRWEATGLCLEALLRWRGRLNDPTPINATLDYLRTDTGWLRQPPRFDSQEAANDTLASVVLASLLVGRDAATVVGQDDSLLAYIDDSLKALLSFDAVPRQFCTIPQVAYYAVEAALR